MVYDIFHGMGSFRGISEVVDAASVKVIYCLLVVREVEGFYEEVIC